MACAPLGLQRGRYLHAELRHDLGRLTLQRVGLREGIFQVELEGFADPRGSQTYNIKLSTQRVNAVRDALIAQGVSQDRILVGAYGKLNRKSAGTGDAAWQQDRRVEMIVLPTSAPTTTSLTTPSGK
jgi:flagellar motor protein MotB